MPIINRSDIAYKRQTPCSQTKLILKLSAANKMQYLNHIFISNINLVKVFPVNYFHILLNHNAYRVIPCLCYISKKCFPTTFEASTCSPLICTIDSPFPSLFIMGIRRISWNLCKHIPACTAHCFASSYARISFWHCRAPREPYKVHSSCKHDCELSMPSHRCSQRQNRFPADSAFKIII